MIALLGTGCSVQREALRSSTDLRTTESRIDTVREQVLVAVHDSVTITKTVTITENEQGDTVRVVQVTDRDRVRDRAAVRDKEEKVIERIDTVYIQKDSVSVEDKKIGLSASTGTDPSGKSGKSVFLTALKWICFIILGLIALIITMKVCLRRSS